MRLVASSDEFRELPAGTLMLMVGPHCGGVIILGRKVSAEEAARVWGDSLLIPYHLGFFEHLKTLRKDSFYSQWADVEINSTNKNVWMNVAPGTGLADMNWARIVVIADESEVLAGRFLLDV